MPSEVFFGVYEARRKAARPGLVYCGDDSRSKEIAAELIRDAGFDPVDAGPLRIACYTEPFALLIGLQFVVMTLVAQRPPTRGAEAGAAFLFLGIHNTWDAIAYQVYVDMGDTDAQPSRNKTSEKDTPRRTASSSPEQAAD